MMIVKFKSADEGSHFLKKMKKMKKHFEDMIECLEEKIENEEYGDEEYDDEVQHRGGGASYRGGRYGYRRGM